MARAAVSKAVILAGGPGSAVCPLASYYPKLAFPLGGDPLLAHLLEALMRGGIRQVAVLAAAHWDWDYRPVLAAARDGRLAVEWFTDDGSKGTAGSLRQIDHFFGSDTFLVAQPNLYIQGLDLAAIAEAHAERGSGVTVVVEKRRGPVADFEHMEIDDTGRVRRFHIPHESSDNRPVLAFSGLYLFEPRVLHTIDRGYTNIKEQLLPLLYEHGIPVHVYESSAVIRQIHTLDDYFRAQQEFLFNGVAADSPLRESRTRVMDRVWVGRNVRIAPQADVLGPVVIGDDCEIGEHAQIIGPTTLCNGVRIGPGARVRESIIWPDSEVRARASVEYSLIADGCVVPENESVSNALIIRNQQVKGSYNFLSSTCGQRVLGVKARSRRMLLTWSNSRQSGVARAIKRTFDVGVSAGLLVVLLPLLAVIAAAIKVTSRGPMLFWQTRCGRGGRPFAMCKFRTMIQNAEQMQERLARLKEIDGPMFKLEKDPRVTRIGRLLRRTSLDELPQLLNVLRGDMSLVGPRPLAMKEMSFAPGWRDIRLSVRPGITGLWQVHGRNSPQFYDWIRWDVCYVLNQSLWLDCKILIKTALLMFTGSGGV